MKLRIRSAHRKGALVFGVSLVAATLLPLIPSAEWWIRIFDFPRLQIAVGLTAAALLWVLFGGRSRAGQAFLAALLAALAWQTWLIFPYTPLARTTVVEVADCDGARRLKLLVANVHQDNREAQLFLSLVTAQDPDVILALETDSWWDRQLRPLDDGYPFSVKYPLQNTYGMHLLSRLPLVEPDLRFLVEADIPSVRTKVALPSGDILHLFGTHPRPPVPAQDADTRDAELLIIADEVAAGGLPAIVAGDLNDVAWSHTTRLFLRISGMLDPRIGRGLYPTFPAGIPGLAWPLDHVFHEESFTLVDLQRLGDIGSDHYPIAITLCYAPQAAAAQEPAARKPGDASEARERIEEGFEKEAEEEAEGKQ